MPKVSVIVPVYNAEKYLDKCFESIFNQTLKDIEVIAINDGSTDNSLSIIEKYYNLNKSRMSIIDQKNIGAGGARNIGLNFASGEFIKFLDADDFLNLDILERMYTIAKKNNVKLVRGNYKTIIGPIKTQDANSWSGIKENKVVDVDEFKNYTIYETPGIGNKLISREIIGDLRFPEKTKWEDLAIMPAIVANSKKVYHLNEPVYNYRVHMNTTISDFIKKIPNVLDIIKCVNLLENNFKKLGLDKDYSDQIKSLYILHSLFRVENALMWVACSSDIKYAVINAIINLVELKYPDWKDCEIVYEYRKVNSLFDFDMKRLEKYLDKNFMKEKNVEVLLDRVEKVFKLK